LASKEAGCINPETGKLAACNVRVYGFFPTTFITNIAAVAGVLAAFMLPVIGAIIDYTEHRQTVGRVVAFLIWAIQTTQIATIEKTWFHMAILQSIVVALFEVHYCLAVSYLPDIARYEVNHDTMTRFNRYFFTMQYSGQTTFLIITLLVSWWFELTSVQNAQLGQSACSFVVLICYTRAWTKLPAARGRRKLPEGRSLLLEGFRQNYRTFVEINRNPNKTLKWFFLTVIIAESGGTSLLPTVVSYLSRVYGYGSLDVGLTFLLAVIFAIPGAIVSAYLAKKTSPKTSLRIDFVCTFVVTVIAFFVLRKENPRFLGYLWGLMWGFCLGWFYSGEQLFYTLCVPPDQEAELAGFFVYCTIIMTWVPSLLYSIIVEKGKDEQYGLIPICILQLLSMISISMIPEWDDVLEGSKLRLSAQASQERDGTQPINSSLQEGVDGGH
jgi:MFS-type transporter involved in bile tolerance (Atg22 family)